MSNVIAAELSVSTIISNLGAPQSSYTTGDIEWSAGGTGYGDSVYAYNSSTTPVLITFENNTPTSSTTDLLVTSPGYTTNMTSYMISFSDGSVTVAPTQVDFSTPADQPFVAVADQGLILGLSIPFSSGFLVVNGGSTPTLSFTFGSAIRSGSFLAWIVNDGSTATIQGQFNNDNNQPDFEATFPLPSFLNLEGESIDQFQLVMWLGSNTGLPKMASKTFKGRPERKRKQKSA